MRNTVASIGFLLLAACGGGNKGASSTPSNDTATASEEGGDPPLTEPGESEPRSEDDCAALLDHIQSVVVEAIDRDGMMTACLEEWTEEQAGCLGAATNDDDVAACW